MIIQTVYNLELLSMEDSPIRLYSMSHKNQFLMMDSNKYLFRFIFKKMLLWDEGYMSAMMTF